jgi:hypothetical protein
MARCRATGRRFSSRKPVAQAQADSIRLPSDFISAA